jgi:hypothetical protein
LLSPTLDLSQELGELSDRLVGRVLALALYELPHERSPESLVEL